VKLHLRTFYRTGRTLIGGPAGTFLSTRVFKGSFPRWHFQEPHNRGAALVINVGSAVIEPPGGGQHENTLEAVLFFF